MSAELPTSAVQTPDRILRRLDWQVIRRLDGLLQGDYRTLFYGDGLDFADLREYQLQDDIRHIDCERYPPGGSGLGCCRNIFFVSKPGFAHMNVGIN